MSKHTPGPWKIRNDITKDTLICSENKTIICGIHQKNLNILSETKANAQLIAAAPDMLETLKQSYEMIDTLAGMSSWEARSQDEIDEVMNQMLNAINKAEGDGE